MLSGEIADYMALAVAVLVFLCVLVVSYFCLELRSALVRQPPRKANFMAALTTGPLPAIEPSRCPTPCPGTYSDQGACNCCSASIVPP